MTPHSQDVSQATKTCKRGHSHPNGVPCAQCNRDRVKAWRKNSNKKEILAANRSRYSKKHRREINNLRNAWRKRNLETASWENMVHRCTNPQDKSYYNYGGRGITVCDRWLGSDGLNNFRKDMGKKPSPRHTIERQDNNVGYTPQNCYWATPEAQARNKRSNILITFQGKTQCVKDWGDELKISSNSILTRLRLGWTPEEALTVPIEQYVREGQASVKDTDEVMIECWGRSQRLFEWAEEMGMPYHRLWSRVWKLKWPIEKALTTPRRNTGTEKG